MSRKPIAWTALGAAAAASLAGWQLLRSEPVEPKAGVISPPAAGGLSAPLETARLAARAPAGPSAIGAFEARIRRELEATERYRPAAASAARAEALRREAIARAGGPEALRQIEERANWEYLEAVHRGEVSGIPNETKAGISLLEMTWLGPIPYVEQLRREGRLQELEALGLGLQAASPTPATSAGEDSGINPRIQHLLRVQRSR